MADRIDVFISYSRGDGEAFAAQLRRRLKAEKLTLWRDRDRMEGGVGWWKQITDALDAVRFMVLVATPEAMKSDIVRKEWRYARQQGVCVYPVQVPGLPIDFAALPRWMRDSHFYNLDKEWETFLNYLKSPCSAPKVPFMPPDLPEHFVPRPREFGALKSQLLDANFDNPVAITTALKGAGGFGKTTLAAALCHDEDIQTAFDDGVLWVTLGEQPDIVAALSKLYEALTGENAPFIDAEQGANKLAERLADLDCLIVIDDVWNSAHLKPFLRGGGRCARLVTTRDAGIAAREVARTTDVDEMTPVESVALLGAGLDGLDPSRLERIAARLGEWALMLEIANGQLRERVGVAGDTPAKALDWLERLLDKRGITGIKRDDDEARKRDTAGVLGGTLGLLDSDERERLCNLAVFKDDENVALSSVAALWTLDEFDTEDLVLRFAKLSLLRYASSTGSIRLHDVIREYLGTQVSDLPALHARLIDAYGDLSALPDVYAWRNIGYHLTETNRADTLRGLLLDYAFLQAKLDATDPNALIADCEVLPEDDEAIRLVKSALSMSAHVLGEHKDQLPYQLTGRLWTHRDQPDIAPLWRTAHGITPLELLETQAYPPMLQAGGALITVFVGHMSLVNGALALDDGSLLSWSEDKTLRRWARDGSALVVFEGHTLWVSGALALDDGSLLSWSRDGTLRRWARDGSALVVFEGHTESVNGALALDDGSLLSWSLDGTLRRWARDGSALAVFEGHTGVVLGARALDDGSLLSWSFDGTLRRWGRDGTPLAVFERHTEGVLGVLVLYDGSILSWSQNISMSSDNTLRRWGRDGTPLAVFEGHTGTVYGALVLDDGSILSWSADRTLRRWAQDGTPLTVFRGHTDPVNGVIALRDASLLSWSGNDYANLDFDNTLRVWWKDEILPDIMQGHTDEVIDIRELNDGSLISLSYDGTLQRWGQDGSLIAFMEEVIEITDYEEIEDVWVLEDGSILLSSNYNILIHWGCDGTQLGVLEEWKNDEARLSAWAQAEGFDVHILREDKGSTDKPTPSIVHYDRNRLIIHSVGQFIGDAHFDQFGVNTTLIVRDNLIAIGDEVGRVIFLRVRGGGES